METDQSYGTWRVRTEGDCQGRTMTDLGTYTGFLDEIAFALADKVCYGLAFEPAKILDMTPKQNEVNISLPIKSGTWDMGTSARVAYFANLLKDRPVTVKAGQYYASVKIFAGVDEEEVEANRLKALVESAKAKLTPEEIVAVFGEES